ncbi:MAG: adenylyl-sulfate reductase subunit alpha [Clostridiales bacterium]|nr:adenylyl-sulfate reductase subunit alpha [Clostridiales bacterium]
MDHEKLKTDILIIGGGTAGCFAAITASELSLDTKIIIAEKANIKRSGCLAAGVNALNAYIAKGHTPDFYVDYAVSDAHGIAREDLLLSMSERLNEVTKKLETLGLVILKDENGEYVCRGNRNIKINGENIKPILANAVKRLSNVTVVNNLNIVDYITDGNRIVGAWGNSVNEEKLYFISAKESIICTGGAAGLYKPNNPGFSRHKMWYCPFNTGAGYAMGIRAGAEMTTFEMRFIALRCKNTIAPTGTIAQGVGAKQINSLGEKYESKYGLSTSQRLWGTVEENKSGRGPCYLKTDSITAEQAEDLEKAYLNMAPSQTLKWVSSGKRADSENVEIEGTEPYIVGGHTASGYWVDNNRKTTLEGLYAAGDVAGGCPQKYVTGALAEGEITAKAALKELDRFDNFQISNRFIDKITLEADRRFSSANTETADAVEAKMQDIMDTYAGGIKTNYSYTQESLAVAEKKIKELEQELDKVLCSNMRELTHFFEVRERLTVCLVLIAHLCARRETRWHCFAENLSFPDKDDEHFLKYINSRLENGEIKIIERQLAKRYGKYEYQN